MHMDIAYFVGVVLVCLYMHNSYFIGVKLLWLCVCVCSNRYGLFCWYFRNSQRDIPPNLI